MRFALLFMILLGVAFTHAEERKFEPNIEMVVLAVNNTGLRVTLKAPDKVQLRIPQKQPKEFAIKSDEFKDLLALATSISKSVKPGSYSHTLKENYTLYLQPENGTSNFEYSLLPGAETPAPESLALLLKRMAKLIKG